MNGRTLLHRFLHWEATTPDRVYLIQPHTQQGGDGRVVDYTWRQVGDQARRMAAHLRTLNLPPRSNIALLGLNSAHWIMADLAIWMAGHVTVPLYPTLNSTTARYILEHSEARLLFLGKMDAASSGWKELEQGLFCSLPTGLPIIGLPLCPRPGVPQWNELTERQQPLRELAERKPEELATIIYTSGSTGNPKGVMHSFAAMAKAADVIGHGYAVSTTDRMLSYLPLAHGAERAVVEAGSLSLGFRVYFHGDLASFREDLQRARPTLFFSVPRLWTKFYLGILDKLPESRQALLFRLPVLGARVKREILRQLGLDQVRIAITASAPLASHIVEWYRRLGLELLDCYGMTENFAISHASRPSEVRIGYVGSPHAGVEARIADSGEVQVKSPAQMMGYYKLPELTAESYTADNFFRTGDRGEIDSKGRLRITGRVKELFKTTKGKYVAPVPIENRLGQHPKIECVCLTGCGQPQPFALLMLSPDARREIDSGALSREAMGRELEALVTEVNHTLEEHEHLDYVVVAKEQWTMENGFLTPTMKIRRNVIEDRYLPRAESWLAQRRRVIWE
jgi:long-chain acyl-CoA synthetase